MIIINYTVYSTEDIAAATTAVRQAALARRVARVNRVGRARSVPNLPETLTVRYWQGRAHQPRMAVRPMLRARPDDSPTLCIKRVERLPVSGVELLAMVAHPVLPQDVVGEVVRALSSYFSSYGRVDDELLAATKIRIADAPSQVESKEQRKARVSAKKTSKAVRAAMSVGLKMAPAQTQTDKKVLGLEAVEDFLSEPQKELLKAYRKYAEVMREVAEASAKCNPNNEKE